jgi:3-methylcrotonyl-CoA carboxylase alpha subunit
MRYRYQSGDRIYEVFIEQRGDGYRLEVDGRTYPLEVLDTRPAELSLLFAGRPVRLYWAVEGGRWWIALDGCTYQLASPSTHAARSAGETGGGETVRAPMPAKVSAILATEGERVEKGETLMLLEAMKMEIRIKAPVSGRIIHLRVVNEQTVEKDQILAEIGG